MLADFLDENIYFEIIAISLNINNKILIVLISWKITNYSRRVFIYKSKKIIKFCTIIWKLMVSFILYY